MLLLIDIFSINKGRGYENPSLEIIVTERCSTGGCPLEEACEHCFLNQSAISIAISYIISVYCEDYAGYFTVILPFLAFYFLFCIFYISGILHPTISLSYNNILRVYLHYCIGQSISPFEWIFKEFFHHFPFFFAVRRAF
jgi:hypothetical protein